jgi:hypothetical protein
LDGPSVSPPVGALVGSGRVVETLEGPSVSPPVGELLVGPLVLVGGRVVETLDGTSVSPPVGALVGEILVGPLVGPSISEIFGKPRLALLPLKLI